jgi:hypothetical protein
MKRTAIALVIVLITIPAFMTNRVGQAQRGRIPGILRLTPSTKDSGPSPDEAPQFRGRLADILAAKQSGNLQNVKIDSSSGVSLMDGTHALLGRSAKDLTTSNTAQSQSLLPTWSDSFTYQGLTYKYTMVGTDPKLGSKTTVIPTVIIPLRFVFPDGQVFDASSDLIDGQTPVQGIINSPIFKNYNFVLGGKSVGNTQYADAFQRANFWDSVSGKARDYHVLLGQPAVAPTQTIVVPDGLGSYEVDFSTGLSIPNVDRNFLANQIVPILNSAQVNPSQLPIMVWGIVDSGKSSGYHGARVISGNQLQTYIGVSYHSQATFNGAIPDIYPLSHEVIEWLDDPFTNNFTPGWNDAFISDNQRCDSYIARDLLETADPVEVLAEGVVPLNGGQFTYHVTEGMFIDFYTRARRSRSINGQYSMFNIGAQYSVPSSASTPCTGHIELNDVQLYRIMNSSFSAAFGVNNSGSVVGMYVDGAALRHGYFATDTSFQVLDYPGASETIPSQLNDGGTIVGQYFDAAGFLHGFVFQSGQFTSIDFPGALDTAALDINLNGDIVGVYVTPDFNNHGFLLRSGIFSTIDIPFHRTTLPTGINSGGKIVGYTSVFYGAPSGYPYLGFLLNGRKTADVTFPGANEVFPQDINTQSDITGVFVNSDQSGDGFTTINGFPYEIYGQTFSLNDANMIVGSYSFGGVTYTMLGTRPSSSR